jgi:hypothetical protein
MTRYGRPPIGLCVWSLGLADIFREIEEDLRRDRALQIWRRHGKLIIALVVLIILGTAAGVGWQNWRQNQAEARGAEYLQATTLIQAGANDQAVRALQAIAAQTGSGYGLLARIDAAALEARTPDDAATVTKGLAALKAVGDDSSVEETYRDLALVLWGLDGVDTLSRDEITTSLQPLTVAPNPWRFTATEVTALAALRAGDKPTALTLYKSLTDDLDAPQSVRARAAEIVTDLQD